MILCRQSSGRSGDHGSIKTEEQATQRAYDCALYYVRVDAHSVSKAHIDGG
jgi:hypothetical protein